MIKNAQPNNLLVRICSIDPRRTPFQIVQTATVTASILRTHSQCQIGERHAPGIRAEAPNWCLHHLEIWLSAVRIIAPAQSVGSGGAYRDRTDDLMLAKQPLSQLS